MTAILASGKNFTANEQVTPAKLYEIIEGADISNLGITETASGSTLLVSSGSAPSNIKSIWFDTTLRLTRVNNGASWHAVGRGVYLSNVSGGALVAGDIVVASSVTSASFTTTTTANQTAPMPIGILAENIANGASGIVLTHGLVFVNFAAFAGSGQFYFATSTTGGKALQRATIAAGTCGTVLVASSGVTTLVPCFLWGQPTI